MLNVKHDDGPRLIFDKELDEDVECHFTLDSVSDLADTNRFICLGSSKPSCESITEEEIDSDQNSCASYHTSKHPCSGGGSADHPCVEDTQKTCTEFEEDGEYCC